MDGLLKVKRVANLWVGVTLFFGGGWAAFAGASFLGMRGNALYVVVNLFALLVGLLGIFLPYLADEKGTGGSEWGYFGQPAGVGLVIVDVVAALWAGMLVFLVVGPPPGAFQVVGGGALILGLSYVGARVLGTDEERPLILWIVGVGVAALPPIIAGGKVLVDGVSGIALFLVLFMNPVAVPLMLVVDVLLLTTDPGAEFEVVDASSSESVPESPS